MGSGISSGSRKNVEHEDKGTDMPDLEHYIFGVPTTAREEPLLQDSLLYPSKTLSPVQNAEIDPGYESQSPDSASKDRRQSAVEVNDTGSQNENDSGAIQDTDVKPFVSSVPGSATKVRKKHNWNEDDDTGSNADPLLNPDDKGALDDAETEVVVSRVNSGADKINQHTVATSVHQPRKVKSPEAFIIPVNDNNIQSARRSILSRKNSILEAPLPPLPTDIPRLSPKEPPPPLSPTPRARKLSSKANVATVPSANEKRTTIARARSLRQSRTQNFDQRLREDQQRTKSTTRHPHQSDRGTTWDYNIRHSNKRSRRPPRRTVRSILASPTGSLNRTYSRSMTDISKYAVNSRSSADSRGPPFIYRQSREVADDSQKSRGRSKQRQKNAEPSRPPPPPWKYWKTPNYER